MQTLSLITHADREAVVAYRPEPVRADRFLAEVEALAARLPAVGPVLNLCADRYCFALAFAACLRRGLVSLLPPAQAREPLRHLQALSPGLTCVADAGSSRAALAGLECPLLRVEAGAAATAGVWPPPQIAADQLAAVLFTSGSTGEPVAHAKRFGTLVQGVREGAARAAALGAVGCAVLGTVPPQHMFGLETTVLLPMQSGGALCAARPFYPADIARALEALPRPRALCSTPVHLKALMQSGVALPALDLVLCATSPLAAGLARRVERRCRAPLLEIYGSTETGQIASRRTAREAAFRAWPGLHLARGPSGWQASGAHLPEPFGLGDMIEPLDAGGFLLQGRSADLVNIAGKRSSLAYLSHQLTAIPGVIDGVYFVHEQTRASLAGVTRLAAMAVAPGLDAPGILAALRERIDPVFLPRPLLLVGQLPRNDTGKLPQRVLTALAAQLAVAAPELFE